MRKLNVEQMKQLMNKKIEGTTKNLMNKKKLVNNFVAAKDEEILKKKK